MTRHSFSQLQAIHKSGGFIVACRCGAEKLVHKERTAQYRAHLGDEWSRTAPEHVEPRSQPLAEGVH